MSCDFLALANSGVQELHPYQAGKPIEELQRELGLSRVVKLASNENPLGPSAKVIEACQKAAAEIVRYPDSNGFALKAQLSTRLDVSARQITLGNGSNDILDLIARVFLASGTSAVFSRHAFIVYPIAVKACGGRAIVTPAKNWGHDLQAMAAAIEPDTRLIFIANPNNPTGTSVAKDELEAFLERVPGNVIVVLDEAYIEFVEDEHSVDGIQLLKRYSNLIVTRTFSKAYGLAGLRVGYSISHPDIADLLNRVRAPFNVNSLGLAAAQAVLDDEHYLAESRRINREGMAMLEKGLNKLALPFIPSSGNFLAIELPQPAMPVYQALLREGVIVRPVGVYEMPDHLRVSIGLPEENQIFLNALEKVLRSEEVS